MGANRGPDHFPTAEGSFQSAFVGPDADCFVAGACEILVYLPLALTAAGHNRGCGC